MVEYIGKAHLWVMSEDEEKMKKDLNQQPYVVANSSGFPLQIGVIHAINQSSEWRVVVEEHPWHSKEAQQGARNRFLQYHATLKFERHILSGFTIR
jgi:hypothetical protein